MNSKLEVKNIDNIVKKSHIVKRYIGFIFCVFLLAITYNLFILPNALVFGGVSGLAILFKNIMDPSIFILLFNIGLLALCYLVLGKDITIGSIFGILLYPIFIKLTANIGDLIILKNTDVLLNVLFAAFLTGFASGNIVKSGFTTGGSDIPAQIISKVLKRPLGSSYWFFDGFVILLGGAYLGIIKIMYAVVYLYIFSLISDKIVLGISDNKAFYIVTDKDDEIKEYILDNLNHGVTVLKAKGGYNGRKENVLLCVVPAKHYFKLKEGIKLIDKEAFFVVTDAYEVKGGA